MKQSNSMKRTISFIMVFSIIYAIFEREVLFLTPILTVLIPFKFMKNKREDYSRENQRILSRLLLFNFISIELVSLLTQNGNNVTFNLSVMFLIYFVYFKMISSNERKVLELKNDPQALYDKMKLRISALEDLYSKILSDMENTTDEKIKKSMEAKLNKLNIKIDYSKKQLAMIESMIDSNENNK